jgi:hypothetical protein
MEHVQDWHSVLGVPHDAGDAEIRAAYRRLARRHHPDLNPGDKTAGARMAQVNAAYVALQENDRRARSAGAVAVEEELEEWERLAPVACERCGRRDASLRLALFVRVLSVLLFTRRFGSPEILCRPCRARRALEVNAFNALLGWWSLAGLVLTPIESVRNALGGRQPAEVNRDLLRLLALQLRGTGRYEAAAEAWDESEGLRPVVPEEALGIMAGRGARARPPVRYGGLGCAGALLAAVPASVMGAALALASALSG